jgi:hypothetical protein
LKKVVSKADIRASLEQEMQRFLDKGGEVNKVPQGVSGNQPGDPPAFLNRRLFVEPKTERTLVPEVVAAIEARRKERVTRKPAHKRNRPQRPRKRIIYDDFGEPLRKVWVEE